MGDDSASTWTGFRPHPGLFLAAVVLAGGRSERFGSDKLRARLAGRTLLASSLGAVPPGVPCVIVGPRPTEQTDPDEETAVWTVEHERFAGPATALGAGLAAIPAETTHVLVLAGDQPFAAPAVRRLLDLATAEPDRAEALVAVDAGGRRQPLLAVYRRPALQRALHRTLRQAPTGASMRAVLAHLDVREVAVPQGSTRDIDTPEDLRRAGSHGTGDTGSGE